jgi:hypothetical protein
LLDAVDVDSLEQVLDPANPRSTGSWPSRPLILAASGGRTVEPVTEEDF